MIADRSAIMPSPSGMIVKLKQMRKQNATSLHLPRSRHGTISTCSTAANSSSSSFVTRLDRTGGLCKENTRIKLPLLSTGVLALGGVCLRAVRLIVELVVKYTRVLLVHTAALLTQNVAVAEMLAQLYVARIVLLAAAFLTKVTPEVVLSEVDVQGFLVQVSLFAELTVRVAPVGRVVWVTLTTMTCQVGSCVGLSLRRE